MDYDGLLRIVTSGGRVVDYFAPAKRERDEAAFAQRLYYFLVHLALKLDPVLPSNPMLPPKGDWSDIEEAVLKEAQSFSQRYGLLESDSELEDSPMMLEVDAHHRTIRITVHGWRHIGGFAYASALSKRGLPLNKLIDRCTQDGKTGAAINLSIARLGGGGFTPNYDGTIGKGQEEKPVIVKLLGEKWWDFKA